MLVPESRSGNSYKIFYFLSHFEIFRLNEKEAIKLKTIIIPLKDKDENT